MHHLGRRPSFQQVGFDHVTAIEFPDLCQGVLIDGHHQFASLGTDPDPAIDLQSGRPPLHRFESRLDLRFGLPLQSAVFLLQELGQRQLLALPALLGFQRSLGITPQNVTHLLWEAGHFGEVRVE